MGQPINSSPSELPDADEIVSETIVRILKHQYEWDGAGTFDDFLVACMIKTMEGLRSGERKHRIAATKIARDERALNKSEGSLTQPEFRDLVRRLERRDVYTGIPFTSVHDLNEKTHDDLSLARPDFQTLAGAIVEGTRVGPTLTTYVRRLPLYARLKMTTEEIAADLGVKPGTIDPYRKRVRDILKKQAEGGD
jgi:DNA-directed RNA polymerase specialized sigma24 family protein